MRSRLRQVMSSLPGSQSRQGGWRSQPCVSSLDGDFQAQKSLGNISCCDLDLGAIASAWKRQPSTGCEKLTSLWIGGGASWHLTPTPKHSDKSAQSHVTKI